MKSIQLLNQLRSFAVPDNLQVKIVHRKDGVDEHYHIKPHQSPTEGLQYLRSVKEVNSWQQNPVAAQLEPQDPQAVKFLSDLGKIAGNGFTPQDWKDAVGSGPKKISTVTDPQDLKALQKGLDQSAGQHHFDLQLEAAYRVEYKDPIFDQHAQDLGNVQELYHGVGNQRAAGLLATSFKTPKEVGSVTGQMFGPGIYFTNVSSKAGQYIGGKQWFNNKGSDEGILLQSDVVLGTPYYTNTTGTIPTKAQENLPPGTKQAVAANNRLIKSMDEIYSKPLISSRVYDLADKFGSISETGINHPNPGEIRASLGEAGTKLRGLIHQVNGQAFKQSDDPRQILTDLVRRTAKAVPEEPMTDVILRENGGVNWIRGYGNQKMLEHHHGRERMQEVMKGLKQKLAGFKDGDMGFSYEHSDKEFEGTPMYHPLDRDVNYSHPSGKKKIGGAENIARDIAVQHFKDEFGIDIDDPDFKESTFSSARFYTYLTKEEDGIPESLEDTFDKSDETTKRTVMKRALEQTTDHLFHGMQSESLKHKDKLYKKATESVWRKPETKEKLDSILDEVRPSVRTLMTQIPTSKKSFDSLIAMPFNARGVNLGVRNLQYPEMVVYDRHQAKIKHILHVKRVPRGRKP